MKRDHLWGLPERKNKAIFSLEAKKYHLFTFLISIVFNVSEGPTATSSNLLSKFYNDNKILYMQVKLKSDPS